MITAILIASGIIVFSGAAAGAIWFVSYARRSAQANKTAGETAAAKGLSFRWRYAILPVALLLLSIILSVYFYPRLPAEVATRFELDGTPDRWVSREMAIVWVLTPQLVLTLLAIGITWGIRKMGLLFKPAPGALVRPEWALLFMGNVIALPQLTVCFAMIDIFSYNSYQQHIMPMWLFLLIILALATAALLALLVIAISKARRQSVSQPGQRAKE